MSPRGLSTAVKESWATSGTGADPGRISEAMPLAFLGPFGFSLCPGSAESLLLGRRVAAWQDSGQEQGDDRLAHDGSQGWPVAELFDHLVRPL